MKRILALLALSIIPCWLSAQTIYEQHGKDGSVIFSDQKLPGSVPAELPPENPAPPAPPPPPGALPATGAASGAGDAVKSREEKKEDAALPYLSFRITKPEDNGSAWANTAAFDVRVAVDPPLQIGLGHAFMVRINGQDVQARFTATEFLIPPEFFSGNAVVFNQRYQLDARIVDINGNTLVTAEPVSFYLRRHTILNRPKPRPTPTPRHGASHTQ